MFKTYLFTDGKRFFRGEYKTLTAALRYGQQDYNGYRNLLAMFHRLPKKHKMVIVNEYGEIVHTFEYKLNAERI